MAAAAATLAIVMARFALSSPLSPGSPPPTPLPWRYVLSRTQPTVPPSFCRASSLRGSAAPPHACRARGNRLINWSSVSSGYCSFRLRISSNASPFAPVIVPSHPLVTVACRNAFGHLRPSRSGLTRLSKCQWRSMSLMRSPHLISIPAVSIGLRLCGT